MQSHEQSDGHDDTTRASLLPDVKLMETDSYPVCAEAPTYSSDVLSSQLHPNTSTALLPEQPDLITAPQVTGYLISAPQVTLNTTSIPSHEMSHGPDYGTLSFPPLSCKSLTSTSEDQSDTEAFDLTGVDEPDYIGDIHLLPSSIEVINPLPFPFLPRAWYEHEGRLHMANAARTRQRTQHPVDTMGDKLLSIHRSKVTGALQSNIEALQEEANKVSSPKAAHLNAVLKAAIFIEEGGPLVRTQEVGTVYHEAKEESVCYRSSSSSIYEILSKHLNITQVYINDKVFLIPGGTSCHVEKLVETVVFATNTDKIVNDRVTLRFQDHFKDSLQYMDSHRDRQVLKALMAEMTSVKFATQLQGISSRQGTTSAKRTLKPRLEKYSDIRRTSQIVRNDFTAAQQYRMTERLITARKGKYIRLLLKEGDGK